MADPFNVTQYSRNRNDTRLHVQDILLYLVFLMLGTDHAFFVNLR